MAVYKRIPFDTMSTLDKLVRSQQIGTKHKDLIKDALAHGGFIAGGAARLLARYEFGIDERQAYSPQLFGRTRDVDIFFTKKIDAVGILIAALKSFSTEPTSGGNAFNIYVRDNPKLLQLQVIHKITYPTIEEMLDSFDFTNVAVAIDRDTMYVAEGWERFERLNQLDVRKFDSKWAFHRVSKYLYGRGVSDLSPSSMIRLTEYIKDTAKMSDGLAQLTAKATKFVVLRKYISTSVILLLNALNIDDGYGSLEVDLYKRVPLQQCGESVI